MKIAIICAMDEEASCLIKHLEGKTETALGDIKFYAGRIGEHDVVIARSGIGKARAASVTALVIAMFKAECVINSGIAGALNKTLRIGDVVFSTAACYHDADFTAFKYKIGQIPGEYERFNASPELIAKADVAASTLSCLKGKVAKGLIVSGDQFVNTPQAKSEILKNFPDALVTECEGAPIAQTSADFGVPFLIIRAVSDCADEQETSTYELNVQQASETSSKLVISLLKMIC